MNENIKVIHGDATVTGRLGKVVLIVSKPAPEAGPSPYLSSAVLRSLEEATARAAAAPAPAPEAAAN